MYENALLAVAAVVLAAAVGPITGWWRYEVIESGSMTPALRVGGVAVITAEPLSAVRVGQVLAFQPPGDNFVRIHRVIALTRQGDQVWVRTKGDANNVADPGPIRLEGTTAFKERFFVPYVGYAFVWLYKRSARTGLEAVFFVLMLVGGLYLIWGGEGDDREAPDKSRRLVWRHRARTARGTLSAEKAAAASMASLSNIYASGARGGEEAPGDRRATAVEKSAS
jgi:signal peptidase I